MRLIVTSNDATVVVLETHPFMLTTLLGCGVIERAVVDNGVSLLLGIDIDRSVVQMQL